MVGAYWKTKFKMNCCIFGKRITKSFSQKGLNTGDKSLGSSYSRQSPANRLHKGRQALGSRHLQRTLAIIPARPPQTIRLVISAAPCAALAATDSLLCILDLVLLASMVASNNPFLLL
mmetsp:Transcript_14008/g.28124  ORF Transcript_14008/g.28124 Transcript_14008/m.28124 type:complete len:118 (+) Transcript_14008:1007-1360(+)